MLAIGTTNQKSAPSLKPSTVLRASLRARGKRPGSITYFYSSKNSRDLVFSTDIEFCCGLLLEGDERVKFYEIESTFIDNHIASSAYLGRKPTFIMFNHDGSVGYREVISSENKVASISHDDHIFSDAAGVEWDIFSHHQISANLRFIHDWLLISPILAQTRYSIAAKWGGLSTTVISKIGERTTLNDLKRVCAEPWDEVFSVAFRLVQLGVAASDLATHPLSPKTELTIREFCHGS